MRRSGQLPNLIIAGVGKAGTTSLFWYLAQHPQVCPSDSKELRYFSPKRYGKELGPTAEYAAHFRHCTGQRYRMEATPGYFFGGAPLITALVETLDDPRVLISLRDPVTRFWSYFSFARSRVRVPKDMTFEQYLEICERVHAEHLGNQLEHSAYWALSSGFYADHVEGWLDTFGDRLRIVFFEDVVARPSANTAALCEWLDIDPTPAQSFDYSVENQTVQYKTSALQQVALAFNRQAKPFFRRHRRLKLALRRAYNAVNADAGDRSELPAHARERLREIYEPSNQRLARQLRSRGYQRLPDWLPVTTF